MIFRESYEFFESDSDANCIMQSNDYTNLFSVQSAALETLKLRKFWNKNSKKLKPNTPKDNSAIY